MIENGIINRYQLWLLITNFQIGSALLFIPGKITEEVKQDGWISLLLATAVGTLFIILTVTLIHRHDNQTIVEISQSILGKPIGFLVGIMYAWFYLHLAAILLREMGDMVKSTILNITPLFAIILMIAILVFLATYHGLEVIARSTELFSPFAFTGFLLSIFLVIPLMKLENLLPVMAEGVRPIIIGALPILGFTFAEMSIFFMIIPFINNHKNLLRLTLSSGIVAGLSLTVMVVTTILVLGVYAAELSIFAPLNVVRLIDLGDFLTRVETIISLTYFFTIIVKMSLSFYAGVLAAAQTFHLPDYRTIITPLIIIVVSLSLIISESIIEFLDYASHAWTPYVLVFSLIIPLLLLGISYIKGKK